MNIDNLTTHGDDSNIIVFQGTKFNLGSEKEQKKFLDCFRKLLEINPNFKKNFDDLFITLNDIDLNVKKILSIVDPKSNIAFDFIKNFLELCKNLLDKNKLYEASTILGQIVALNAFQDEKEIQENITVLNARIAIKNENISSAKSLLLDLLKNNPDNIEALYRYIDVCKSSPESDDEADKYQSDFKIECPNHPKHILWEMSRFMDNYQDFNLNDYPISMIATFDIEFQEEIYRQYVILLYRNKKFEDANNLFEEWKYKFPQSHLILYTQFICKTENAIYFNSANNPDKTIIDDALNFSNQYKETVYSNLSHRQKTTWDYCEFILNINLFGITGSNAPKEETINKLFNDLLNCYFDRSIDSYFTNILSEFGLPAEILTRIIEKILKSNYQPSIGLVNSLFVSTFGMLDLDQITDDLLSKTKSTLLIDLKESLKIADNDAILENLHTLNDDILSISVIDSLGGNELKLYLLENLNYHAINKSSIQFNILKIHISNNNDTSATKLIAEMPHDNANYFALKEIAEFLWDKEKWYLFNLIAKKMLEVTDSNKEKAQLTAMLAQSYYHTGDYARFEENALKTIYEHENEIDRNIDNSLTLLINYYATSSLEERYKVKKLYNDFKHKDLSLNTLFIFSKKLVEIGEYYEGEEALFKALYKEKNYTDEIFYDSFFVVNPLIILEKHKINLQTVAEGVFVKLNSLDEWFYIGSSEYAMGAITCEINNGNYLALIGKQVGDTVNRRHLS